MRGGGSILRYTLLLQSLIAIIVLSGLEVRAQVESPDRRHIFREDSRTETQRRSREVRAITSIDRVRTEELDFSAPQVEYDQEANTVRTSGGITITRGALSAAADEAEISIDTENVALEGNILVVTPEISVTAESARMNIDSETGEFTESEIVLEEGGYRLSSSLARKLSETEYTLFDCSVTTCHCPDRRATPWKLTSRRVHITQNEYAYIYDARLHLYGVPVLYTPFFAFPVKEERSTGLLPASYGYSGRDGVQLRLPFFWVLDDYSDVLISPFLETETRYGSFFDYRRIFSQRSQLDSRFLYSNERPRNGDLRGTRIDNVFDPTIDEDRFGGYLSHRWRALPAENYTLSTITDLRYASDNLLVREIEDSTIGDPRSRYLTSRAIMRAGYGPYLTGELLGEYNQALITNQDTTFQRAPELRLTGLRSFRPFGFNPYGLRLATRTNFSAVNFVREDGYDGLRLDLNPVFRLPFYYRNYLSSELELGLRQTNYFLSDTSRPSTASSDDELERTNDRSILNLGYTVSTALERVYDVDSTSWLARLTESGPNRLRRVRHTLEPLVRYNYVPQTFQDDLPVFDSIDRIRERSLITYELKSSLYGRFSPEYPGGQSISELTPEIDDLPVLDTDFSLEDFGGERGYGVLRDRISVDRGEIREIASFRIRQNYDYLLDRRDDSDRSPWSDVATVVGLYPTRNFGFALDNTINVEDQNVTSWGITSHARTGRGDSARARFSYIENSLNQIEGNLQMTLTNQVRLGYYGRYDELARTFVENRVGLRFVSGCNCWYLDAVYSDTINPDRSQVMLTLTLRGIGDVTQTVRLEER